MRQSLSFLAAFTLAASLAGAADAANQCRDASGKFVKCATSTGGTCRNTAGKFVKCGTPGAMPAKSGTMSAQPKAATGAASNTAATAKSTTTKSTMSKSTTSKSTNSMAAKPGAAPAPK